MTTTWTRKIIRSMGQERWWTFRELYHDLRNHIDGPQLQKALSNLTAGNVLERHITDEERYRVREPQPSEAKTAEQLINGTLKFRSENGCLREGDWNRMRVALMKERRQEAQEMNELEEQVEDLARRRNVPDLSFDEFKRIVGLSND